MLEKLDLSQTLGRKEYRARLRADRVELRDLQYQMSDHGIAAVVVLEGWAACGKGKCLSTLVDTLDPRWMRVHPISEPLEHERLRPFLWRFWVKTPPRGMLALFDHSWYGRVLKDRVEGRVSEGEWRRAYGEIKHFERWLADDCTAIVKLWFHITEKEQGRRLKRHSSSPATAWRVTKEDWREHRRYAQYLRAVEEMLERTSTAEAPWTLIPAIDPYLSRIRAFESLISALRRAMGTRAFGESPEQPDDPSPVHASS